MIILVGLFSKILNIGIVDTLGLESRARVKLQNSIALYSLILIYFFIFYHFFYTQKIDVAVAFFVLSFFVPLIFLFQYKQKYIAAKIVLFLFLYVIVFMASMVLLVGHGNEYYYITISILILILNKNAYWTVFFLLFNVFLFLLPHYYYPNIQEEFIVSTHLAVFISALLAVLFFKNVQNKFRAKLKEQKVILENLNEEKDDLMSVVAHDLKSPLTQIQGLVNIIKIDSGQLNKEQLVLIEKIKTVTDNQYSHITSYLNVKALEDSIEKLELGEVSVGKLIQKILDQLLPQAEAKNIELVHNSHELDLAIVGSEEGFFKVLSNLISNSIKYSYPNTTIKLDVDHTTDKVLVKVKDEGQGFTAEDLEHVFKKNQVLSAKPTANESSSGVGLYIVKKYIDRMHGKVWLESEKNQGTTFFITLPRAS